VVSPIGTEWRQSRDCRTIAMHRIGAHFAHAGTVWKHDELARVSWGGVFLADRSPTAYWPIGQLIALLVAGRRITKQRTEWFLWPIGQRAVGRWRFFAVPSRMPFAFLIPFAQAQLAPFAGDPLRWNSVCHCTFWAGEHPRFSASVLEGRPYVLAFCNRRGGRVVYRTALEMRSVERHRGFESHPLRHFERREKWRCRVATCE
jgi:hypothetical protein